MIQDLYKFMSAHGNDFNVIPFRVEKKPAQRRELCSIAPSSAPRPLTVSSAPGTPCAMFFGCDDLVFLLFESMKSKWYESVIRQDAARFMLVNRAFYYYSIPLVWISLSTLKPLYTILQPVNLAHASSLEEAGRTLVASSNWKRFLFYASFVQHLHINSRCTMQNMIPFLTTLVEDGTAILPSVNDIWWDCSARAYDELLWFLGHHLRTLTINIPDYDTVEPAEKEFSEWCRRIYDKAAIMSPHLKALNLMVQEFGPLPVGMSATAYFTNLHQHQLSVQLDTADGPRPELQLASIGLNSFSGVGGLSQTLSAFAYFPKANLRRVDLSSRSVFFMRRNMSLCSSIEPLLELGLLEDVTLHFPNHLFIVSAEEILTLARTWRGLTSLQLTMTAVERNLIPDIRILDDIVALCPRLKLLELPKMKAVQPIDEFGLKGSRDSVLTHFTIKKLFLMTWHTERFIEETMFAAYPALSPHGFSFTPKYLLSFNYVQGRGSR